MMDFNEWVQIGIENKWCGPAVCHTHDWLPLTADEESAIDEGDEPCIHILRLYADEETAAAVEENHAPSIWRKPKEADRG
jgi:hypothetical protein